MAKKNSVTLGLPKFLSVPYKRRAMIQRFQTLIQHGKYYKQTKASARTNRLFEFIAKMNQLSANNANTFFKI